MEEFQQAANIKVDDWGVTDVTLEDVFIKIAAQAGANDGDLL